MKQIANLFLNGEFKEIHLVPACLAGALLPFAFAPHNWWPLAFISLLILWRVWRDRTPKQVFLLGLMYGLTAYGIGLNWLATGAASAYYASASIGQYVRAFITLILAFCIALTGYIFKRCFAKYTLSSLVFVLPAIWVILEYLRSWVFTGLPLYILGYAQVNTPLKYYATLGSVHAISWAMLLIVSLIYVLIDRKVIGNIQRKWLCISLSGLVLCPLVFNFISWTTLDKKKIKVSILQTNIPVKRRTKLSFDVFSATYGPLTSRAKGSDLVIWPETSFPWTRQQIPQAFEDFNKLATRNNFTLIMGGLTDYAGPRARYFNTIFVLGVGEGIYYKQQLMPFGEYFPYDKYLGAFFARLGMKRGIFQKGPRNQEILHYKDGLILPTICQEIGYPENIRKKLRASSADLIVNLSEENWYTGTWFTMQYLDIARIRAIETGRYVLRSSSNGISAVIDPDGKVIAAGDPGITQLVQAEVHNASGFTPWTYLGAIGLHVLLILSILIGLVPNWKYLRINNFSLINQNE